MAENKCTHCGSSGDAIYEYKAEPEEGIPAFFLCRPCVISLCDQLIHSVSNRPYGIPPNNVRVPIVKNFIHQK